MGPQRCRAHSISPPRELPHRTPGRVLEAIRGVAAERVHQGVGGEDVEGRPVANVPLEARRDGPVHPGG